MKKFYSPSTSATILTASLTLIFLAFISFSQLSAQCSTVGTGTVTGNVNFGSSNNWANPNRSTLSDDLRSNTQLAVGEISKYLSVTDYGYVIPPGATIDGIEVEVEGHQEDFVAAFADASIRLTMNGLPIGDDRAGMGYYDDKDYVNVYGSPTDLWGLAWTPAEIMDPTFGVLYSVTRTSGSGVYEMRVDYIQVTVYFSGSGCVLPVTYKAYDVVLQSNQTVKIDWITSNEANSAAFAIERSQDGLNYEGVGTVAAAGNSDTETSYSFTDFQSLHGTAFYRLKQMDYNGQSQYSEVRQVVSTGSNALSVTAYPNPATHQLSVAGDIAGATARLYDLTGKLFLEHDLGNGTALDVSKLGRGSYLLKVSNLLGTAHQRVLIQ
jgi:hypothetical protein